MATATANESAAELAEALKDKRGEADVARESVDALHAKVREVGIAGGDTIPIRDEIRLAEEKGWVIGEQLKDLERRYAEADERERHAAAYAALGKAYADRAEDLSRILRAHELRDQAQQLEIGVKPEVERQAEFTRIARIWMGTSDAQTSDLFTTPIRIEGDTNWTMEPDRAGALGAEIARYEQLAAATKAKADG